ncbi:hypothetical protein KXV19_009605, partial [Aspergillus fumigatus]
KASPGFASIANIITPTRNTESFTPINDERRLPVFIKRLVTALNDQENQQIMRWSEDGNTVVIVDEQELTTKLLPDFNTTTYFSFTQQLSPPALYQLQRALRVTAVHGRPQTT